MYHLVDESPWPLLCSLTRVNLVIGLVILFYKNVYLNLFLVLFLLVLVCGQWWRDVRREGRFLGLHTGGVDLGLR
jgi:hypothetical protein